MGAPHGAAGFFFFFKTLVLPRSPITCYWYVVVVIVLPQSLPSKLWDLRQGVTPRLHRDSAAGLGTIRLIGRRGGSTKDGVQASRAEMSSRAANALGRWRNLEASWAFARASLLRDCRGR